MDAKSILKSIEYLLDSILEADRVQRITRFTSIKTLCDLLENDARDSEIWNGYIQEKLLCVIIHCGAIAGIRHTHESLDRELAYAYTELDNLRSDKCFNVN